MRLKKARAPVDSDRGTEITTALSLVSLNPVTLAHIQRKHSLVFPMLCKVESCFPLWWPLSELLNSRAQNVEILLPIDSLWTDDGEISLMLASNNQQSATKSRKVSGLRWMMVVFCEESPPPCTTVRSPTKTIYRVG